MYFLQVESQPDIYKLTPQNTSRWGWYLSCMLFVMLLLVAPLALTFLQHHALDPDWNPYAVIVGGGVLLAFFLSIPLYRKEKVTRQSINEFTIALSKPSVTVGNPFTFIYTLSFKQSIPMEMVRLQLLYREVGGEEGAYSDGFSPAARFPYRQECTLPVHQIENFRGDPAYPLIQEFQWSLPLNLLPYDSTSYIHTRENWRLSVYIKPLRGRKMEALYSFPVDSAKSFQQDRRW